MLDTGHNCKTDALDAHSIAVVAVRTKDLRVLAPDDELEALRMLTDRREGLTRLRVQIVNQQQRLLSERTPGQAKKDITALEAKPILATVRRLRRRRFAPAGWPRRRPGPSPAAAGRFTRTSRR